MCYNIRYLTKKKLQYARRFGNNEKDITELEKQLTELGERIGPTYQVTGFDHPNVPVITNEARNKIQLFNWGLIPSFVNDEIQGVELSNRTLNARGEEMFEKRSYKHAAAGKRCLVIVDGFFEYHWKNGKSFPHHIELKNGDPFALGGLWETWETENGITKNSFTIVTTSANPLMAHIHNKPKGSDEPRMPLIIPKELEDEWLKPSHDDPLNIQKVKELIVPYDEDEMKAYPVSRLTGKNAVGNTPKAIEKVYYPELEESQGELF